MCVIPRDTAALTCTHTPHSHTILLLLLIRAKKYRHSIRSLVLSRSPMIARRTQLQQLQQRHQPLSIGNSAGFSLPRPLEHWCHTQFAVAITDAKTLSHQEAAGHCTHSLSLSGSTRAHERTKAQGTQRSVGEDGRARTHQVVGRSHSFLSYTQTYTRSHTDDRCCVNRSEGEYPYRTVGRRQRRREGRLQQHRRTSTSSGRSNDTTGKEGSEEKNKLLFVYLFPWQFLSFSSPISSRSLLISPALSVCTCVCVRCRSLSPKRSRVFWLQQRAKLVSATHPLLALLIWVRKQSSLVLRAFMCVHFQLQYVCMYSVYRQCMCADMARVCHIQLSATHPQSASHIHSHITHNISLQGETRAGSPHFSLLHQVCQRLGQSRCGRATRERETQTSSSSGGGGRADR